MVLVDSGNLTNTQDKLELIAWFLSQFKYDAVGIGASDLAIPDFCARVANHKVQVLDTSPDAAPTTKPYVIKVVDGVRVGIVSFGSSPMNADGNTLPLRTRRYAAFKEAREQSDVLILLDQARVATQDWIERNSARLGAPDVVVGGVSNVGIAKFQVVGKTHIVQTGMQGKTVGVVDVEFVPGGEPKLTCKLMQLNESVTPDDAVARHVADLMAELANKPAAARTPPPSESAPPIVPTRVYYASTQCKVCHLRQYEDWRQSKHAAALDTLTSANRKLGECLSCHSEQFRSTQTIVEPAGGSGGVECASCHFDSLPHGLERKSVTARVEVSPQTCLECHTTEWSPQYDEKSYMARVSHSAKAASGTAPTRPK